MSEAPVIVLPRAAVVKLTPKQIELFWKRVKKGTPEECWDWLGRHDRDGYGIWAVLGTPQLGAHCIAYRLGGGSFEEGPVVRHFMCHNPGCVNPDHLCAGTVRDNMADRILMGRFTMGARAVEMRDHPEIVQGSNHPKSLLTEEIVLEARRIYDSGQMGRCDCLDMAKKHGVAYNTLRCAITRRSWKHIP